MILRGPGQVLYAALQDEFPNAPKCPTSLTVQMLAYQMLALYGLASRYNRPDAAILEIGTGHGSSAFMLSKAAPLTRIVSLTTSHREATQAISILGSLGCANVQVILRASWDYIGSEARVWNMIFVDGDHKHIARDIPWFNRLAVGGLFLCHDYTPSGSPMVYAELNSLAARLGRPFDISIIDDGQVGMVGFYRRTGETA